MIFYISIHALREEGDLSMNAKKTAITISIHALREEGDNVPVFRSSALVYFYPRPP